MCPKGMVSVGPAAAINYFTHSYYGAID